MDVKKEAKTIYNMWLEIAKKSDSIPQERSMNWEAWVCEPVIKYPLAPRHARAVLEIVGYLSGKGISISRIIEEIVRLPGIRDLFPEIYLEYLFYEKIKKILPNWPYVIRGWITKFEKKYGAIIFRRFGLEFHYSSRDGCKKVDAVYIEGLKKE